MTGGMLPPGMKPSGALTSRTPTLEERTVDWLRKLLYTDDREGTAKAENLLNTGRFAGAVDIPLTAYDVGKAGAEGGVLGPLMAMILSVPGISKNTADELFKMRGNRDLYEMFEKTGYWLDPNYTIPKTMIGPEDNKDLFTSRFYEEINKLKKSPGDKVDKYIALDAIAKDPTLAPTDFRVVAGITPGTSTTTEGMFKPDFNQAIVFPDRIRTNKAKKSEREQLNSIKGISLHELTHGSQHNAGQQDSTWGDYYTDDIMNLLLNIDNKSDKKLIDKADEVQKAMGHTVFKNSDDGTMFNANAAANEYGIVDFLSYLMHPSEREARASEDMITKSLDERARSYLKGEDSSPRGPYRSTSNIIDVLHKLFVTGELDASKHMMAPTKMKPKL